MIVYHLKIKKERAKRLIELSKELEIEYMNKFVGKTVEVLTENNKDDITYGHTGNFLHVKINSAGEYVLFSTEPEIPVVPGRRALGKGDHFQLQYSTAE